MNHRLLQPPALKFLTTFALACLAAHPAAVSAGVPRKPAVHTVANQSVQVASGLRLSHPFGVAVDSRRHRLFVSDSLNRRVLELSASGAIVRQWRGWSNQPFTQPGAIAVGRGGSLYVIDYGRNRIDRFAADGRPLSHWGAPGNEPGQFAAPTDVATDLEGDVYVADTANFRIQKFSSAGELLGGWSTLTVDEHQFMAPLGIGVGRGGDVFVSEVAAATDRFGNIVESPNPLHSIQRFSPTGLPLDRWGVRGTLSAQFQEPRGITVGRDGQVYVADFGNDRIEQFSPTGAFEESFGPAVRHGFVIHGPIALALDGQGMLYIADWFNSRIDRLSPTGSITGLWR